MELHGHGRFNRRVRVIALQRKVLEFEGKDVFYRRIDVHAGQRTRLARQLLARLLHVVGIQVCIAEGVHEIAGLQIAHLRDHQRQQRVGCDVERYTEEDVRAALV